MTREDAKKYLETLGVSEPTDEQISGLLNRIGAESSKEKAKAEKYKADADKAAELQKQLDDINSANMSEIEKANKATEDANNRVAELEKQMKTMQLKADLATNGIVGESADKLLESIGSGSFDASILGQIIEDKTKTAIADFEKKKLEETPNPRGGQGDGKDDKPADVLNAEQLVFGNTAPSQEQKDFYVIN